MSSKISKQKKKKKKNPTNKHVTIIYKKFNNDVYFVWVLHTYVQNLSNVLSNLSLTIYAFSYKYNEVNAFDVRELCEIPLMMRSHLMLNQMFQGNLGGILGDTQC